MSRKIRNPKLVYGVVVDGKCEVWYFKMLQRQEKKLPIVLKPDIATNLDLEKQIKIIKENLSDENYDIYDKIFWIIDFDVIQSQFDKKFEVFKKFYEYLQINHPKKVVIVVNNPCLEYWFLLHHKNTSKPFSNCEESRKELKKHLKEYEKSQTYFTKQKDIYFQFKDKLPTAIERSRKLGTFNINNPKKSVCEMWKFFDDEHIKSILK